MITAAEDECRRTTGAVFTTPSVGAIANLHLLEFFFISLFNCRCFILSFVVCSLKCELFVSNVFVCLFLAVSTPNIAVTLLYITEVAVKLHQHYVVPQQFQLLFFHFIFFFFFLLWVAFFPSPVLLFAVAQIIKRNYWVCTNPILFLFLLCNFLPEKTENQENVFERIQGVKRKN